MARVIIFLVVVALIAGMVGCVGGDGNNGGGSYMFIIDFTAGGTVTVDDVPLPGKAILNYGAGTVVSLNATPSDDYQFMNWTGNVSTIADVNAGLTTITMNDNYSITANFDYVGPRTVIELDFLTFWHSGDFQAAIGHKAWMDKIAARVLAETGEYEISWNDFYGVEPAPEIYSLVRDGVYDIGVTGPSWSAGIFPLWEGTEYPGDLYRNNAYTMSLTIQALYDEFTPLQNEMAAQNLKVMHFWSTGPYYLFMTPGNEVRTLADFPGKTIRVPSFASAYAIEALGAEPLRCSMPEAKEMFEAGLLDGILCPGDTPKGFGLYAYVKHCTFAQFSYQFVFMKLMNTATWNALPVEVQTIFNEVNEVWPAYYGQLRTWGEADGLKYCEDNVQGWEYFDWRDDPANYQAAIDATAHLIDEWIGGDATRQVLWDKFVELDEYYATTPPYSTWTPGASPPPVPTFP